MRKDISLKISFLGKYILAVPREVEISLWTFRTTGRRYFTEKTFFNDMLFLTSPRF